MTTDYDFFTVGSPREIGKFDLLHMSDLARSVLRYLELYDGDEDAAHAMSIAVLSEQHGYPAVLMALAELVHHGLLGVRHMDVTPSKDPNIGSTPALQYEPGFGPEDLRG